MSPSCTRWLAGLLALVFAAAHAGDEPLADGLTRCSHEGDDQKRLACFDALVGTLPKIKTDEFGMTAKLAHKRDPSVPLDRHTEVLTGKLAEVQEVASGQWFFTLDNGQLWIQVEPRPGMRFSAGESIQIEPGAMGSLWIAADHHRKAKVKRLR